MNDRGSMDLARPWALPRRRHPAAGVRRAPALLVAAALATATLVSVPLLYIVLRAAEGGWSAFLRELSSPLAARLLSRTLALAAAVLAVSLAVAVPTAWLVARTDLPGRRFWAVAASLPLVFPSYVSAFCLVAALGPRGDLQRWLEPLGVERLPPFAYGFSGALLALSLCTYPYLLLLLVAALCDLDPALEESSASLGVGRWATFLRVVLPQLRPALLAGSLLVVLYSLADFGAVSITRFHTFTLGIYDAYRILFDRSVAASLSCVLVGASLAVLAVEALLVRRVPPSRSRPSRPALPQPLGRWRTPALLAMAGLTTLALGVPVAVVIRWAVRALAAGRPLGTAWELAGNSLLVSLAAAAVAVTLAVPPAVWAVRHPNPLSRATERVSQAGYALPGLVVALALVFAATRHLPALYQTLPLLVAAYVVRFLPAALGAARAGLVALSPAFEEAGRSLGRGGLGVLWTVTLPLIRPGLLAGGALVFLTAMKELPATLILRPVGFETLATRIWSTAGEAIYSQAAVPTLMLLLASAPPVYLLMIRPALGRDR